jgi:hypothetical protein
MKKLFTLFLVVSSLVFFSQTAPVIEGTYYPVRNTSIKQVWDTTLGSMSIPAMGQNMVWDYRNINNQFTHIADTFSFAFKDPAQTPYASYFPSATHATFMRTPFANVSDSLYSYWKVNQNGLYNIGGYSKKHGYDTVLYTNPMEFYAPNLIHYLDNYIDTSYSTIYAKKLFGQRVKIKERKIKNSTVSGWGTLKLPNGTYNNVTCVTEISAIIDSIFIDWSSNNNYTFAGAQPSNTKTFQFLRNNTFGSAYLMYLNTNPTFTQIKHGWYTLPVDFGSITGTVYTNTQETTPVTSGEALLYRENSNFTKNDILARANLNSLGNYKFDSIPYGEYRIAIRPNETAYPNSKITYYGDTTNWIDASSIITTTTTSVGHKIHLQYQSAPLGSNNISGQLGLNLSIMRTNQTLLVKPIPSIGIVVKKNPGSSAERVMVTDTAGKFNIGAIENGTYELFVDIPGLHMAGTYSFTVIGGNVINGLDFTVGTDSIHPINSAVLGIKDVKATSNSSFINAYPNPYNSVATIVLSLPESANVLLEVYNMLGEKVQILDNSHKQTGTYKYSFSARSLNYSSGMYFVKLTAGNKTNVLKIVEQ